MFSAARGAVRWGYFEAAALEGCAFSVDKDKRRRVVATVRSCNDAYLQQRPLRLVVLLTGGREWAWPIESHTIGAEASAVIFRAIVGTPETGSIHGPSLSSRPA